MREHGALSRVAVGWGENTVGQSAPSEPAACFVGGRISERVEKKRGSHGPGFRVAGPSRRLRQWSRSYYTTALLVGPALGYVPAAEAHGADELRKSNRPARRATAPGRSMRRLKVQKGGRMGAWAECF